MIEQNLPQAQAIESRTQQLPYGVGGGPSEYQSTGGHPSQAFQQPLTRELAMQQNPGQQQPAQQIPAQQQSNPMQSPGQQTPAQQQSTQQVPAQQNPQEVEQRSQSGGAQQQMQQPQTGAGQSGYQSTLINTPSNPRSAQLTGHGASAQSGVASSTHSSVASPAQPYQSQQLQGAGQPQFTTPTSAGPYGSQSAMIQSPTVAPTQGPSVQGQGSEFSAGGTAGTQFRTASSAGPQWQATEAHQAPSSPSGYEQAIAQELRAAVDGLDQLANAAEWAGTRFAQQGAPDASRACEDVHDRSHTVADFMLRGSPFAASAARELQATIAGATQELQQHSTSEAQEVLTRAQQANQLLEGAIPRLTASATQ